MADIPESTNDAVMWLNAETCIQNAEIAYENSTEDEGGPVDTVIISGDLGVVIDLARYAVATRAAPPAMDREAVDFLHQLRRVNTERYQVRASRPLMLCDHCGATERVETERCAPPFSRQPHSFTKPHPYLTVENDAGIMFDAIELGGEVGELLNVVKKLEREERGWRGSRADPADFADECADVLICLDKLARRRGVDLIAATTAKFNATSDKVGLPHRLSTLSADAIRQGEGWQPIETAPFDRMVLIDCERFEAVCEAIQYRGEGWKTFGANGPYACRPIAWREKPVRLATPASHASDVFKALIAEAKRQRRQRPPSYLSRTGKLLWRLGWHDVWFLLKAEIAKRRPVRWAWQAKCAWLLYSKWNAPRGHEARATFRQQWDYAGSLAEMLDEAGGGYMSPAEAIDEDRQYWGD